MGHLGDLRYDGWVGKRKSAAKARSTQKKEGLPKGAGYDWWAKESYEGKEKRDTSSDSWTAQRDVKAMKDDEACPEQTNFTGGLFASFHCTRARTETWHFIG